MDGKRRTEFPPLESTTPDLDFKFRLFVVGYEKAGFHPRVRNPPIVPAEALGGSNLERDFPPATLEDICAGTAKVGFPSEDYLIKDAEPLWRWFIYELVARYNATPRPEDVEWLSDKGVQYFVPPDRMGPQAVVVADAPSRKRKFDDGTSKHHRAANSKARLSQMQQQNTEVVDLMSPSEPVVEAAAVAASVQKKVAIDDDVHDSISQSGPAEALAAPAHPAVVAAAVVAAVPVVVDAKASPPAKVHSPEPQPLFADIARGTVHYREMIVILICQLQGIHDRLRTARPLDRQRLLDVERQLQDQIRSSVREYRCLCANAFCDVDLALYPIRQ